MASHPWQRACQEPIVANDNSLPGLLRQQRTCARPHSPALLHP